MFALDNKSLHSIILVLKRQVGKVKIDIGQRETEICPVKSPSGGGSPNYERRAEQQRLNPWWPRAQPLYWREPGGHHASPWQRAIITIIYVQPSPSNAQTPAILHSSIFLRDSARSFSNPGSLFDSSARNCCSLLRNLSTPSGRQPVWSGWFVETVLSTMLHISLLPERWFLVPYYKIV